jgi:exopolysaccharide production protein ExoY
LTSLQLLRETAPVSTPIWKVVNVCERAAAILLMIGTGPVLAGSALVVWRLSHRSPWIAHRRIGHGGKVLWMLKLRTMWDREGEGAGEGETRRGWIEYIQEDPGAAVKRAGDPRVSHWFARFCRSHSIDELPQLWHVIRGEMALIGPRPMTAAEIRQHYGSEAGEVLELKPGMAGLWQTSGRNRLTYPQRREMDLLFVRRRSLGMYARIWLRILPEIWRGSNSW